MAATYFHDFTRDNGLLVTVEYSARGGEANFDHPGHICDGGGSGPEISIVQAWPNTPGHNRLASISTSLWLTAMRYRAMRSPTGIAVRAYAWAAGALVDLAMRADSWWRASLTMEELERFESWLAEHHVEEPYEPEVYP